VAAGAGRGAADGVSPMLPYDLIPLIAVIWLTVRHVRSPNASTQSKSVVVSLAVLTVLIGRVIPASLPLTVLLQIAICAYIILHQMIVTHDEQQVQR
jgi:hypothetical protein